MGADRFDKIETLYRKMYRLLFEYAYSSLLDRFLAEEAVQETFRIACQKTEDLCDSPNPEGWLVNTLKNVSANTLRSQATAQKLLDRYASDRIGEFPAPDDRIGIEVLYSDLAQSDEFVLLKELAIDKKTHLEMARKRGISVAACKKRVQRAKEILREKIEK